MKTIGFVLGSVAMCALLTGCGGKNTKGDGNDHSKGVDASDLVIEAPESAETSGTDIADMLDADAPDKTSYLPETILGQAAPLFATGTEPYWTAEIGDGWIAFDRPGLPLVEVPLPEFAEANGKAELVSEGLKLNLELGGCAEAGAPVGVSIAYQDVDYLGCAVSANGATTRAAGDTSWKELIEPSLKAIDACLDASDGRRLVLALYPREPGTVGMILQDDVGSYAECGADVETGEVSFLDPMSPDQAEDWTSGAAFARTDKSPVCNGGEALPDGVGVFLPSGC